MIFHSEKAQKGTRAQINGIIEFLEKQYVKLAQELQKYQSVNLKKFPFTKTAIKAVQKNMKSTLESIAYYKELKNEYTKKGLI